MFPALTGLFGGGLSAGGGTSRSGDADGTQAGQSSFASQYNAAFQVGGSGSSLGQSQTSQQDQRPTNSATGGGMGAASAVSPTVIYVALGVVVLVSLLPLISGRRS